MNVAILQQRMDLIMFLYAVLNTVQLPYLKCMLVTFLGSDMRLCRNPVVLRGSINNVFYEKKLNY